jgi:AcrR family transcriptional regulator
MSERHETILATARQMLSEGGGTIRMRELAERSGVALGTLYNRFGGQDALAAEAVAVVFRERLVAWEETKGKSVQDRLHHRLSSVVEEILRLPAFAKSMVAVIFRPTPQRVDGIGQILLDEPQRQFAKALIELKKGEQLAPETDIELLAEDIVLAQYSIVMRWAQGAVADHDLLMRLTRSLDAHLASAIK